MQTELERLYDLIRPALDYNVVQLYKQPLNKPFLKSGGYSQSAINYCEEYGLDVLNIGGPFSRVSFEEPNLSSPEQIKKQLFKLGWIPTDWNYKKSKEGTLVYDEKGDPIKTSAKLKEDSYASLKAGIGPDLRTWMIYSHRLSQIIGFLENLREDSTIPSVVDSCGTPTARVRHKVITNIPRPGSVFGKQLRELFIARPGRVLVGEDRSQIEARLIAHISIIILGHTKLADAIMDRDFHQVIFEALEGLCTNRQAAKTPEYAFFFGAKERKLGQSIDNKPIKWTYEKAGKEVIKLMRRNIPGIIEVREALGEAAKSGYIMGLDGRKFFVRKHHAALNTFTQGNAQVCCKHAMIEQQKEAKKRGLDTFQVGYFHDETQNDTDPKDAEEFGHICKKAIQDIGVLYKLKVPLAGEFKVGPNWNETH